MSKWPEYQYPQDLPEELQILSKTFSENYMNRPPVGAVRALHTPAHGSRRPIFQVWLKSTPTPEEQKRLHNTFGRKGVGRFSITYEDIGGQVIAYRK